MYSRIVMKIGNLSSLIVLYLHDKYAALSAEKQVLLSFKMLVAFKFRNRYRMNAIVPHNIR